MFLHLLILLLALELTIAIFVYLKRRRSCCCCCVVVPFANNLSPPVVVLPDPLTIITSTATGSNFAFTSSNGNLIFTSAGNPDVVATPNGGNFDYIFSTPNATYIEKDGIAIAFDVISFTVDPMTNIQSIVGGIYSEASPALVVTFTNNNLTTYSPGLNFGSTMTNMSNMFVGCMALTSFTIPSGSQFGAMATAMNDMFPGCGFTSFTVPAGSSFGASATDMTYMFDSCDDLVTFTISEGCPFGSAATNMNSFIRGCPSLTTFTVLAGCTFGAVALNIADMFDSSNSLTTVTISDGCPFGGAATNMERMFQSCTALSTITINAAFGASMTTAFNSSDIVNGVTPPLTINAPSQLNSGWQYIIPQINIATTISSLGNTNLAPVDAAITANPLITYIS
jgi:hypothetical protein